MEDKVPTIMENVFECTLEMINKDFSEYPEHRVEFFKLLKAINLFCFPALLKLDGRQFKFVIDSCMWASKHDNREVENTGLTMCIELMDNMADSEPHTASMFFQQFFVPILQDVFFVLTDSDHKAGMKWPSSLQQNLLTLSTGFKSQSSLLARMFYFVESGKLTGPVYTPEQAPAGTSNKDFLRSFIATLLQNAFTNLQPSVPLRVLLRFPLLNLCNRAQIHSFVESLFNLNTDITKFKLLLRDFLIQLKEFSGDNTELFAEDREDALQAANAAERAEKAKVGGLLKPADLDQDDEL